MKKLLLLAIVTVFFFSIMSYAGYSLLSCSTCSSRCGVTANVHKYTICEGEPFSGNDCAAGGDCCSDFTCDITHCGAECESNADCPSGYTCASNCVCQYQNPCQPNPCPAYGTRVDGEASEYCKPNGMQAHDEYTGTCNDHGDGTYDCPTFQVVDSDCSLQHMCSGNNLCPGVCWSGHYACAQGSTCTNCALQTGYKCTGSTLKSVVGSCAGASPNAYCATSNTTIDPDCASHTNWYNLGGSYGCCLTGNATTCQDQQHRTYNCQPGLSVCNYVNDSTRTVDLGPRTSCITGPDTCFNSTYLTHHTGGTCNQPPGACSDPTVLQICQFGCASGTCLTNPPPVVNSIGYGGSCKSGETMTIRCNVTDADDPTSSLIVKGWAGVCTLPDCFNTRSWSTGVGTVFFQDSSMTWNAGNNNFTSQVIDLTMTPPNTPIAATCRGTDPLGALSGWGNGYPICITNSCPTPPSYTFYSIPTAKSGPVIIMFNVSRMLQGNPVVNITKNTGSGPFSVLATFVSLNGLTYTYTFNVQQAFTNGDAQITVTGLGQTDACYGQGVASITIDTTPPTTTIQCNKAACLAKYTSDSAINVTFGCADATSGCSQTTYNLNGGPTTRYTTQIQVTSSGNQTFIYRSNDTANNLETDKQTKFEFYSQILCGGVVCAPAANECISPNVLRQYTTATCYDGVCVSDYNDLTCQWGCQVVPGAPDVCADNPKPELNSMTLQTQYLTPYAKKNDLITVTTSGSDPGGEQLKVVCGSTPGDNDLCTGALAAANPTCNFDAPWLDTAVHAVYCFLQDSSGYTSNELLNEDVSADNTAPSVTLTTSLPNNYTITPGTQLTLYVFAGDEESGVKDILIFLNGQKKQTCLATTCNYTFVASTGLYNFTATVDDNVGNSITSTQNKFSINTPPSVSPRVYYTGSCITNGVITLFCNATDLEDSSNLLSAKFWAGDCTAANCLNTAAWTYANNASMTYQSGKTFVSTAVTIRSASGTGVAASCRATDTAGALNQPIYQGDAFPICIVNGCTNPPTITVNSVNPGAVGLNQMVNITFTVGQALQGNPTVFVTPNGQSEVAAQYVTNNGLTYTYNYTVRATDADGTAVVRIHVVAVTLSCPQDQRASFVIDRTPPVTDIICNGEICNSAKVYRSPAIVGMICHDPSGCWFSQYGVDEPPTHTYSPSNPPYIIETGNHSFNYQSFDKLGNVESRTQNIRVYNSSIDEEAVVAVGFDKQSIIIGQTMNGYLYCFLRDSRNPEIKTRDCNVDGGTLKVTVDPGTVNKKDYLGVMGLTGEKFVNQYIQNAPADVVVDGYDYHLDSYYQFPIPTGTFHSQFCINATDNESGIGSGGCNSYSTANSEIRLEVSYPDLVNGVIPRTSDGLNAPNFTRLMPIMFKATPIIVGTMSASQCRDAECKVYMNDLPPEYWDFKPPIQVAWSGFDNAYVPTATQVASGSYECNTYHTFYIQAIKQSSPDAGINTTNATNFFINCDTKLLISPVEKRLAVGEHPGKIFDLTMINPTDSFSQFTVAATTTDPNNYPLAWINFVCPGGNCNTDGVTATLDVERQSSVSLEVEMPTAVKSGAFPVTFVATAPDSSTYPAIGNILIFSEGLTEFSNIQLIGLVALAISFVVYYSLTYAKTVPKPAPARKRKNKGHR